MPDSFLYFFPRMGNKRVGLSNFKSTFRGAMPFFFFHGRGHSYLLYLLMDFASPPPPRGINNEWCLSCSQHEVHIKWLLTVLLCCPLSCEVRKNQVELVTLSPQL